MIQSSTEERPQAETLVRIASEELKKFNSSEICIETELLQRITLDREGKDHPMSAHRYQTSAKFVRDLPGRGEGKGRTICDDDDRVDFRSARKGKPKKKNIVLQKFRNQHNGLIIFPEPEKPVNLGKRSAKEM